MKAKWHLTYLIISILLYIISLTMPVVDDGGYWQGSWFLFMGWLALLDIGCFPVSFIWLANFLLLLSWIFLNIRHYKASFWFGLFAMMLSILFLLQGEVPNAGGGLSPIDKYNSGYFLWLSSSVVMVIGNILKICLPIKPKEILLFFKKLDANLRGEEPLNR